MNELSRRDFVKAASLTTCALAATGGASEAWSDEPGLSIIDTHQHLWDLTKFRLPWLAGSPDILRRSYVTSDYLAATEGLQVVKAVYMEVDVDPAQHDLEAEHITDLCRSGAHPTVAAVVGGRPGGEDFTAYLQRLKDNEFIKGVRQVLHGESTPSGFCLQPQFVRSMQLLGEYGRSFDLCLRPTDLGDAVKLVSTCRETRFILDHCGNADPRAWLVRPPDDQPAKHDPDAWRRHIDQLAAQDNVSCKISGVVASLPAGAGSELLAPIINHCCNAFGPERIVFGGDWPVCLMGATYARWLELLTDVIRERPVVDQRRLLHDNALRVYRLG